MKYILFTNIPGGVFFRREKMVKIGLQLKAQLENVTGIEAEGEDFRWDYQTHFSGKFSAKNCFFFK